MKVRAEALCLLALSAFCSVSFASQVYSNTFDNEGSLEGFTIIGESFVHYDPPPLHTVSVESGQLRIETDYLQPNAPSTIPTLLGRASLSLDTGSFEEPYNTILSQNSGIISWSFNISNEDYRYNNSFSIVLANTAADPFDISGHGYRFKGGGMVGDRMGLWRFDYGTNGGQEVLIDITDGLGVLPEKGSFRITYNPVDDLWSLFGEAGSSYVDPEQVTHFLGSAVDGTYTRINTPYLSIMSGTTGNTYFDNVTVSVVPEPVTLCFLALGGWMLRRGKSKPI